MIDKVAIVGAGLVGRAWAISFARGRHRVVLFDADDKAVASALGTVESSSRIRSILLTSFPRSNSCPRLGPIRRSLSARAKD
jgi:3-hydroxyacyl-CoA dehydrogenase